MNTILLLINTVLLVTMIWLFSFHTKKAKAQWRAMRSHQTSITARRTSTSAPQVDARARTSRRDTNDLPATGRQSHLPTYFSGGDSA